MNYYLGLLVLPKIGTILRSGEAVGGIDITGFTQVECNSVIGLT